MHMSPVDEVQEDHGSWNEMCNKADNLYTHLQVDSYGAAPQSTSMQGNGGAAVRPLRASMPGGSCLLHPELDHTHESCFLLQKV